MPSRPDPSLRTALLSAVGLLVLPTLALADGTTGDGVPPFVVRDGFRVTVAADDLPEARFVEFGDDGTLYLSQPAAGQVMSLKDADGDGTYETRAVFVKDQPNVHSMDFHGGYLYFTSAQLGFCKKAKDADGDGVADEVVTVIPDGGIPAGGGHAYRGILVSDDRILITVSDPQNMTGELDTDRKKIYAFDANGSDRRVFASGIRNTEKINFRVDAEGNPTDEVWGCDHGSDWFGKPYGDERGSQPITDLLPPGEVNHYVEGGFYGHPYLVGNRIPRPEYADRKDLHELAEKTTPPAWDMHAHVAPNGHCFLSKDYFPGLRGNLLVAQHGSWNSSEPVGYAVSMILFDPAAGTPYGELPVVKTVGRDRTVYGRPVDCAEAPDGTVLFSDDQTKRIYRISRVD